MLRVGVIGFGGMGAWMAEALAQTPGMRLAGVAEPHPARAEAARAWGVPSFSDYRELLEGPLDAVYIATPNALHKEHLLAALERGLPAFLEKPVALSLPDADEMIAAAGRAGVPVLVNFSYRFSAPYGRLRSRLRVGDLGELLAAWVRSFRGYGLYANGVCHPAVAEPEASGGWVVHHAIHAADWLLWVGGPAASVTAHTFASSPAAPGAEGVLAQVAFRGGAAGQLADSVCGYREHSAGLLGTRGTAVYSSKDGLLRWTAEPTRPESGHEATAISDEEGYRHVAAHHFAEVVRGEAEPRATLADGRAALQLALALSESASQGITISL
jgi:myo-inositol 2-dehydrogenase/D-chiro-inositol 1-dehydrogenase